MALLFSGCAKPEEKLGRGFSNSVELLRMGEIRRSVEQTSLFEGPQAAYTTGVVRGFNKSLVRTGVGLFEIVTFPLPPYKQVFPNYLAPGPVYPDSYRPGMISQSVMETDTHIGFSGGDVAPMIPGSRFRVFDN